MSENQDKAKRMLAESACKNLQSKMTLGLGAGSTVMWVVEALRDKQHAGMQVVVASLATQKRCLDYGIDAELMESVSHIDLYIDGADEVDESFCLIKGRGGAMTGEKLCAQMAENFMVLVDESKCVKHLGESWPVIAIEVVPWARSSVARQIVKMGGRPELREQKSDMRNDIIDCYEMNLSEPYALSREVNQLTGVVGHGLFVNERPQIVKVSDGHRVWELNKTAQ